MKLPEARNGEKNKLLQGLKLFFALIVLMLYIPMNCGQMTAQIALLTDDILWWRHSDPERFLQPDCTWTFRLLTR